MTQDTVTVEVESLETLVDLASYWLGMAEYEEDDEEDTQ